jgi:hypothetical protein
LTAALAAVIGVAARIDTRLLSADRAERHRGRAEHALSGAAELGRAARLAAFAAVLRIRLQIDALREATRLRTGAEGGAGVDAFSEPTVLTDVALLAAVAAVLWVVLQVDASVVAPRLAVPALLLFPLLFLLLLLGFAVGQPKEGKRAGEGEAAQEPAQGAAGARFGQGTGEGIEPGSVYGVNLSGRRRFRQ